jgi:hypothetical protein
MAAAADGKVTGMSVRGIGSHLARDPDGMLREGPIVVPVPSQELRESIDEALRELPSDAESWTPPMAAKGSFRNTSSVVRESLLKKAIDLRDYFVRCAKKGDAFGLETKVGQQRSTLSIARERDLGQRDAKNELGLSDANKNVKVKI